MKVKTKTNKRDTTSFEVQLFIRELHNGFHLVEVIGEEDLCLYVEDLDKAREELELVLNDRIERTNPGRLGRLTAGRERSVMELVLSEALVIETPLGPEHLPTKVTALVSRDRRFQRLWFPRWDARYWLPVGEDLEEGALSFLVGYLTQMTDHERLQKRYERREWVETLTIEAEVPALESFTGKMLGHEMLPSPSDKKRKGESDPDEPEDDEDDEGGEGADEQERQGGKGKKNKRRKKKRPPTPTLKNIAIPVSRLAREGELERAWGRDEEVEALLAQVGGRPGAAVAVVGPASVGKTTLLSELVYRIVDKKQPAALRKRPVWFVDASRLIAGEGFFGDWQRQCLDVIQECLDAEVIWFIGNLLPLLDAGKSIGSQQNVSLLLKPFLSGKRLTILGECTTRQWAQLELRDAGFARLFTPFQLEEPTPEKTRQILGMVARELFEDAGVRVDREGLRAIEELCRRFAADGSNLGRAIHFLRRVVDDALVLGQERVGRAEVVARFCGETGMPPLLVRDDLPLDPASVLLAFQRRLIGQDEAVRRMVDLVAVIKAGLSDLRRPLGSFLFVGPTGVGKTEMAKALAEFLFGREDRLIRFDMSEFVGADSVHRFVGSEGQEGRLVSAIRRAPFSVVLLDEIEKAHPAVFDVLLQVLGEARLSDQAGRTADFRNAVILMTSNLGVSTYKEALGFGGQSRAQSWREHFMAEAARFFRPEFFNRIDAIVPFEPLGAEAIELITEREVDKFLAREGVRQREVPLSIPEPVRRWLAEHGVEPRYGARPLKRLVEQALTAPLARQLSAVNVSSLKAIEARVGQEGPVFEATEGGGKGGGGGVRVRLLKFLQRVSLIRAQVQRWERSPPVRELRHSIRLLERLSRDKNFWRDRDRAELRMRDHDSERTLRDDFERLAGRIYSVEELAYEMYYDRNRESLDDLTMEFEDAVAALSMVEWRLFAQRFVDPDRAVLYMSPSAGSQHFLQALFHAYISLADWHGWKISFRVARPPSEEEEALRAKQAAAAQKAARRAEKASKRSSGGAPGDAAASMRAKKSKREDMSAWSWETLYDFEPLPREVVEEARSSGRRELDVEVAPSERAHRRDKLSSLSAQVDVRVPMALVVQGPMAACWLWAEHGLHQRIDSSETVEVKVRFHNPGRLEGVLQPGTLQEGWPTQRCRLDHVGRHLVYDLKLGAQQPSGSRLASVYMSFMRAHRSAAVFGADAVAFFEQR